MKPSRSHFITGLLIGVVSACVVFAVVGQRDQAGGSSPGSRNLTVAHALSVEHPVHKGLIDFGKKLEELSGGSLTVTIFPSEQLGTETECLEKIQQGGIDVTKVSAAPIGNFVPVFKLFSLPYLFRDRDHYWQTLDGEVGDDLLDSLGATGEGKPTGLVGLGYYDAGSRSFYTTRPVNSPADMAGMKIRVMPDPVAQETIAAMGASAVVMSFGELYTYLKQGGVDGAENNPPSYFTSRHFEVCKHYVLDRHSSIPDVLVASRKMWETLNETERGWFLEAAHHSSLVQREIWKADSERALEELKANGVTVVEPDTEPFREAVRTVTEKFATGERAEFVRRIKEVK